MIDRSTLATEQRHPASGDLDAMSTADAVALMHAADADAVAAVGRESASIAAAVELVAERLRRGGSLVYFGAGSSGRLGVLDASEIPPTFRAPPGLVRGVIAGGREAMFAAQENAEDSEAGGAAAVDAERIGATDVVFGIAASGTTPFVWGALRRGRELGAGTVFLSCVSAVAGEPPVDVAIRAVTGPEILTGSTRLKAGTATKLVLNTVSTLAMVRLGKVYGNRMVDLRAANAKLRDRAIRMTADLSGLPLPDAEVLLVAAGWHVKSAVVMARRGVDVAEAVRLLDAAGGSLRAVVG